MLEYLCVEGTTWDISTQGTMKIPRTNLLPHCKVWYHFLKNRLMPSMSMQMVSKERLLLLDFIIIGRLMDVGKIIHQELCSCVNKLGKSLWFSSFITGLYLSKGVHTLPNEEKLSMKGAITIIAVARIIHPRLTRVNPDEQFPKTDDEEWYPAP